MSVELAMKGDLPAATQRWIPTQPSPQGGWAYVSNFHTQEARVPRGGATRILAVMRLADDNSQLRLAKPLDPERGSNRN
jgi:hypothetical protein